VHSRTPASGVRETPGVEATTGPLGQESRSRRHGIAEKYSQPVQPRRLSDYPVPRIRHRRDGDLQEGVSSEASSLADTSGLTT